MRKKGTDQDRNRRGGEYKMDLRVRKERMKNSGRRKEGVEGKKG
jgi:hypothetical protein